jgi:hypothetical protein
MTAQPRVDRVSGSYFRQGRCVVCGKSAEGSMTFTGAALADCDQQADAWYNTPLVHRRCEGGAA